MKMSFMESFVECCSVIVCAGVNMSTLFATNSYLAESMVTRRNVADHASTL